MHSVSDDKRETFQATVRRRLGKSSTAKDLHTANASQQPSLRKHRLCVSSAIDADQFVGNQVHDQDIPIGVDCNIER